MRYQTAPLPEVGRSVRQFRPIGRGTCVPPNRQRYIDQARVQKEKLRLERTAYLLIFFKSHPCVECGEDDPVVLEFDHLRDKALSIGRALECRAWRAVLDEMQKCEVVCANCHRRRTAQRRGALRAMLSR